MMELNDVIQILSNSLKSANQQIAQNSKDEVGYPVVEFSISFPADFKIENKKSIVRFVDMKTQLNAVSVDSKTKRWPFSLFTARKNEVDENKNIAMINVTLKPIPH